MVTFDDVLPTVARVCEAADGFDRIDRCAVVRDLRGNVRLVVDRGDQGAALDLTVLEASLTGAIGAWFAGPMITTGDARERGRLARAVFEQARPWEPIWRDPATGDEQRGRGECWCLLERRLSKDEWLSTEGPRGSAPWPLHEATPGIVTFYSFKGGVGRTTAPVSCAWQLARRGKRVALIDLDLEAPGLGSLLECSTDRGVLDFVVDHLATGSDSIQGLHQSARSLGTAGDKIFVMPAGKLGLSFIEKLGRLDFVGSDPSKNQGRSPVELALEALLLAVRRELQPDYILIDSRAGLHDLAGLSLHRLAHVDVLVGRASSQGYEGLDLTIAALAARKSAAHMRTVILHTMTPPDPTAPEAKIETQEFRDRVREMFSQHVYKEDAVTIGRDAPEAHHIPITVPFELGLTRFNSLRGVERYLFGPGYAQLIERIETLCAPEDSA